MTISRLVRSGFLVVLVAGAGCSSTHIVPEAGSPEYADTDAARVQLIPWAPNRPYERLGEVIVEPAPSASWQEVDLELRNAAADLGGHAMYVVWDPSKRYSVVQVDPVESDRRSHYPPNGIVAVVIRFK
ncbi:MAG TPA: hypothetical protein PLX89_21720 [Verrucomicrobiota bacterium]|nr:hypothetical protein [Verrucomicrobiota bacterium]